MTTYQPSHASRRYAAYKRSGSNLEYVEFLSQQWAAYDAENGITVHDRAFSLTTYHQSQDQFTAWLENHYPALP